MESENQGFGTGTDVFKALNSDEERLDNDGSKAPPCTKAQINNTAISCQ